MQVRGLLGELARGTSMVLEPRRADGAFAAGGASARLPAAPVHPWPWQLAGRWERRWALSLERARKDTCTLLEEGRAHDGALRRLRAVCVRVHVQQLTCWAQVKLRLLMALDCLLMALACLLIALDCLLIAS